MNSSQFPRSTPKPLAVGAVSSSGYCSGQNMQQRQHLTPNLLQPRPLEPRMEKKRYLPPDEFAQLANGFVKSAPPIFEGKRMQVFYTRPFLLLKDIKSDDHVCAFVLHHSEINQLEGHLKNIAAAYPNAEIWNFRDYDVIAGGEIRQRGDYSVRISLSTFQSRKIIFLRLFVPNKRKSGSFVPTKESIFFPFEDVIGLIPVLQHIQLTTLPPLITNNAQ